MLQDTYFEKIYAFYMYFFVSNLLSLYFKIPKYSKMNTNTFLSVFN